MSETIILWTTPATFSLYADAMAGATLSQSELFQIYLEHPVRVGATTSSLVVDPGRMSDYSARDCFIVNQHSLSEGDFAEVVLRLVEGQEFPSIGMANAIDELSALVDALKQLREDFDRLAEATRTEQPDDDAPDEVYNDWEQNPRYVLHPEPVQSKVA